MEAKELLDVRKDSKHILIGKLKEFVRENGETFTEIHKAKFGMVEDEQDDVKITKLLDFYDNSGCFFPVSNKLLDISTDHKSVCDLVDELDAGFSYWAFQCLYIEVDDSLPVKENLKYYALCNGGVSFSDSLSEPDHDYVSNLPLEVICKIIDVIEIDY